jgi:hypothetical protein
VQVRSRSSPESRVAGSRCPGVSWCGEAASPSAEEAPTRSPSHAGKPAASMGAPRAGDPGAPSVAAIAQARGGVKTLERRPRGTPRRRGSGRLGQRSGPPGRSPAVAGPPPAAVLVEAWRDAIRGEAAGAVGGAHRSGEAADHRTASEGRVSASTASCAAGRGGAGARAPPTPNGPTTTTPAPPVSGGQAASAPPVPRAV